MPKRFTGGTLHRTTQCLIGDPAMVLALEPVVETEYRTEFNLKPKLTPLDEPIMLHPSPRWPHSFKKHYVHNSDYGAMERRFQDARARELGLAARLEELEAQIGSWRVDNNMLLSSMGEEHAVVSEMQTQFSTLADSFQHLLLAVQQHHQIVGSIEERAHGAILHSSPSVPSSRAGAPPVLLTASGSYNTSGQAASSPFSSADAAPGGSGHATMSVGVRTASPSPQVLPRAVTMGRTTSAGLGLAAQLEAIQAQLSSLASEVQELRVHNVNRSAARGRTTYRPLSAPLQQPAAPSPQLRKRPPMVRLKPPAEPIEAYPVDAKTGRTVGDTRGYWRP